MSDFLSSNIHFKDLYQEIAAIYHFPLKSVPTLYKEGIDNDFYSLNVDNNQILIRINKRDVTESFLYEIDLLEALGNAEVKVPKLIKTKSGELFLKINNILVTCFEYIPHEELLYDANHKPPLSIVSEAGYLLGKLHTYTYKLSLNHISSRTIYSEIERALKMQNFIITDYEGGQMFIDELNDYLKFGKENVNKTLNGIIHNDYVPGNLLFFNNKVQAVIDLNWSCPGPFIKDLGLALAIWSFPDKLDKHWSDVFDSFLSAYNESSPQIIENNKYLYQWICFSCLYDAATFFADLDHHSGKIVRIVQNRRYRKYKYFEQFI